MFLLAFNPNLQKLQNQNHKGYKLGNQSYVTLPYTDDFCLISTNKATHQTIINKIQTQVSSMGMKIKPTKWRRFSLCAGKPKVEIFHIGDKNVPSIRDEEQKS